MLRRSAFLPRVGWEGFMLLCVCKIQNDPQLVSPLRVLSAFWAPQTECRPLQLYWSSSEWSLPTESPSWPESCRTRWEDEQKPPSSPPCLRPPATWRYVVLSQLLCCSEILHFYIFFLPLLLFKCWWLWFALCRCRRLWARWSTPAEPRTSWTNLRSTRNSPRGRSSR